MFNLLHMNPPSHFREQNATRYQTVEHEAWYVFPGVNNVIDGSLHEDCCIDRKLMWYIFGLLSGYTIGQLTSGYSQSGGVIYTQQEC